jgi:SAM-dependent methyltransferase
MGSMLVEDVIVADRRKESERQFHNDRFGAEHDVRQKLDKWYRAVAAGTEAQNALVRLHGRNGDILEYGCADGRISLVYDHLADGAAKFCGIDISDRAIDVARLTARAQGLSHCEFTVMDAEQTTFPDGAFDVVFGHGILHHLDLARCFPEIARILRPGGRAIFTEPLGHNPALNLYRKLTPRMRTPDEHPLLMADLRRARGFFSRVDCTFYGLTTVLAVPFLKTSIGPALLKICERIDRYLLRVPLLNRNAWSVLITLTR